MQVFEVSIEPMSDFGTPLVGDSLFGHLAWRFQEDPSLAGSLKDLLVDYLDNPFLIVSDSFPTYKDSILLPKPVLPLHKLDPTGLTDPKSWKKSKYYLWDRKSPIHARLSAFQNRPFDSEEDQDNALEILEYTREHNSINRLTGTTGEGFAPYSTRAISYPQGGIRKLFLATRIEESAIKEALVRTGQYGYGRDASTGMGRFQVKDFSPVTAIANSSSTWSYTLGLSNPMKQEAKDYYMEPVTRFGKLGGSFANHKNPFKNPILYAGTGSVFSGEVRILPSGFRILGKGLANVSLLPETVAQGASLALPMEWGESA